MPESSSPTAPHRNHGLFSDHYLDERLATQPSWPISVNEAAALAPKIVEIFDRFTPTSIEAQTEKTLTVLDDNQPGNAAGILNSWSLAGTCRVNRLRP